MYDMFSPKSDKNKRNTEKMRKIERMVDKPLGTEETAWKAFGLRT